MVDVSLDFSDIDGRTCSCEVPLGEYPQLKVLPKNSAVRIIGTVQVTAAFNLVIFEVKDAKLFF
jgi:hypothetical protein